MLIIVVRYPAKLNERSTSADDTGRFTKNWVVFAKAPVCLSQNDKAVFDALPALEPPSKALNGP